MSTKITHISKIDNLSLMGLFPYFLLQTLAKIDIIESMPNVRKPADQKAKTMGISLPPELIREAKKQASAKDMSFSKYVRTLLQKELQIDQS
jgi:predicted DNA binding CopG/RHH family protein